MTQMELLQCVLQINDIIDQQTLKKRLKIGSLQRSMMWLQSNSDIQVHQFETILCQCFGSIDNKRIPSQVYKQILGFRKKEMNPYVWLDVDDPTIEMRWARKLSNDNIESTVTGRLEFSLFLTAIIATELATYAESKQPGLAILYIKLFNYLGLEYNNDLILRVCPDNYIKAKKDWSSQLFCQEELNHGNRRRALKILPYDILCITIFLALWKMRYVDAQQEKHPDYSIIADKVAELWSIELHLFAEERQPDQINYSLKQTLQNIHSSDTDGAKIDKKNADGLVRDPRFQRQANLYYNVDMMAIHEVLKHFTRQNLVVLDIGCGDGEVTCSRFSGISAVSKVIAVDRDTLQLETAQVRINHDPNKEKFLLYQVDVEDPDFIHKLRRILRDHKIGKVDIVFSSLTFHYLKSPESVISHIKSILADDGYLILRELDDETKIYYSQGDVGKYWMQALLDSYYRVFHYTDRNCARKMHSWLSLQGYQDIKLFYDPIDVCGKTEQEKEDIFHIMVGFRKARAEKMLATADQPPEVVDALKEIVKAGEELQDLFHETDFWFFCINYAAIARKNASSQIASRRHPPIEIYLIRHAHCDLVEDKSGIVMSISKLGQQQILALTQELKNIKFDEVICSEMERSYLTAAPIAESHNRKLKRYSELNEIDRGDVPSDQMWENVPHYYRRWKMHETDMPFPNGENGNDVWHRVKYVIDRVYENAARQNPDQVYRVCIFTHGGALRSILCGMMSIPQELRYQFGANIHPCAINILRIAADETQLVNTNQLVTLERFNDTSFLPQEVEV